MWPLGFSLARLPKRCQLILQDTTVDTLLLYRLKVRQPGRSLFPRFETTMPEVVVCALQDIAAARTSKETQARTLRVVRETIERTRANLIVLPEMSNVPYFCNAVTDRYLSWAETIPGPYTEQFSALASEYKTTIVLPVFEVVGLDFYYNSAVLIGPTGDVIRSLCQRELNVEPTSRYRKVHLPASPNLQLDALATYEKYYFRPGHSFPVFPTPIGNVGVLICWDKRFTEAWRLLALSGADLIVNPSCLMGGWRGNTYRAELQIMALYNQVFVIGCSKSGKEELLDGHQLTYSGGAHIFDPRGKNVVSVQSGPLAAHARVDMGCVRAARRETPIYRDRRPELYGPILD